MKYSLQAKEIIIRNIKILTRTLSRIYKQDLVEVEGLHPINLAEAYTSFTREKGIEVYLSGTQEIMAKG